MRSRLNRGILAIMALFIALSCGVTRHTPEGSYFLQRIDIIEDKAADKGERIPSYELESYVSQTPNKRFLGTNFYVWVYNLANPEKENGWNNFKRKVGQAPIYYDEILALSSTANIKTYLDSQGYYSSRSHFDVDTTRRRRAIVAYSVEQGAPYIVESHNYIFRDTMVEKLVLRDSTSSLVKVGSLFNATTLNRECERIASALRQRGYYSFSINNVEFLADTLMGDKRVALTTIIKQQLLGYDQQGAPIMGDNTRFSINAINIAPDFDPTVIMTDTAYLSKVDTTYFRGLGIVYEGERANVREKVLRQAVPIYPNTYFNSALVEETYKNLISTGYFKSAKVLFEETDQSSVNIDSMRFGRNIKIDSTLLTSSPTSYLNCNILCTPALNQSVKLEAEASSTSSFYGLSATAGYQNRNIFRGAEAFNIALTTGYEYYKSEDATKRRATEVGLTTGLSFPRFILPVFGSSFPNVSQPKTNLEVSTSYQDRPYYTRTLVGTSWDYSWRSRSGKSSYVVRPINIDLIDIHSLDSDFYESLNNDYLEQSFETQLVAGLSLGYAYNSQGSNSSNSSTTFICNFESSGNLVDALEKAFDTPSDGDTYHIFGIPYAQYVRSDVSLSRKVMLGEVTAIAARWYSGVGLAYGNSLSLPFDRLFYTGGSNSMRGWSPRTLGPGSTLSDDTDSSSDYPNKVGDVKLEANLELRYPLWGNIHGATFFDVGNVWYMNEDSYNDPDGIFHFDSFYKQLGFNTGLGIRIDITFAVLRFDWGIQLHNPNLPEGSRWITKFNWDYTSLNFGVGYPF
ncbi:MAG: BamA/TamA family outer membrane protein [Rikenellaceae bacterium]